jgi:hypothetical protein
MDELKELHQTDSVDDYIEQFERLLMMMLMIQD